MIITFWSGSDANNKKGKTRAAAANNFFLHSHSLEIKSRKLALELGIRRKVLQYLEIPRKKFICSDNDNNNILWTLFAA